MDRGRAGLRPDDNPSHSVPSELYWPDLGWVTQSRHASTSELPAASARSGYRPSGFPGEGGQARRGWAHPLWQRPFLRGWMQLAGVRAAFVPLLETSLLPWSSFWAWWARSAPSGFYQGQLPNEDSVKWRRNTAWAVTLRFYFSPAISALFISPLMPPFVGIHPGDPQAENLSSLCS